MQKIYFILISILFIGSIQPLKAQLNSKQVDELVLDAMKKFNVAGVSVGIVKDGEIVHAEGYGLISVKDKKKVNEHTQFAIASNSKAYTAAAMALLVEEGKLNWTDKVQQHIPEFTMYNSYVTANFTVQDLLTHRSGLGLGIGDLMVFSTDADFTIDDIIGSFKYFEPVSDFRTKFDYDNLLYLVAGEVIQRITGQSWEAYVTENIIKPLGMNDSYASLEEIKDRSNLAKPHVNAGEGLNITRNQEKMINGAAAGIYSSANDMCKWMLVNLNEGKYGKKLDQELFSARSLDEMWSIHTVTHARKGGKYNSHFAGYGLGYFLTDVLGNMQVSHTGGLSGMLSKTTMIPDLDFGVVVLTNTSESGGALFSAVSNTIVDSYLGLEDADWTNRYYNYMMQNKHEADSIVNAVWETTKTATNNHLNLDDFVGVYKDNWFGKIEISEKEGNLYFESKRSPNYTGQMFYYKANTYAVKWNDEDMHADAFVLFMLDEEGKAQSIKMKGISPEIDFSYDFEDLDLQRVNDN